MVFIQKYRIKDRSDDIARQSWLLSTDSLYRSPLNIPSNICRYRELAVYREIAIYFQKVFFFCFYDIIGADIYKLLHKDR